MDCVTKFSQVSSIRVVTYPPSLIKRGTVMSCACSSWFALANSSRHNGFTRESRIFAVNEFYVKHSAQNIIFTCQEELSGSINFCKFESACSKYKAKLLSLHAS